MFIFAGNYISISLRTNSDVRKNVICAPCVIAAASLSSNRSVVFLATRDNRIWRVSLIDQVTSSRNQKAEENNGSEDIFGDLLHQDNHPAMEGEGVDTYGHIRNLTSDNLFVSLDSPVLDLVIVNNLLYVLVDSAGVAVVNIYQQNVIVEDKSVTRRPDVCINTRLATDLFQDEEKPTRHLYAAYLLKDPQLHESTYPEYSGFSGCLPLSTHLFTFVFGGDAVLVNSTSLILTTNNGCVYTCIVKVTNGSDHRRVKLLCQLDNRITGVLQVTVKKQTSHTGKNSDIISALETALFTSKSKDGDSTALCICSQRGRCCLFLPPDSQFEITPGVLRFSIGSTINSCIFKDPYLVYTTAGSSVESCQLQVQRNQGTNSVSVVPVVRTLIQQTNITQLLSVSSRVDSGQTSQHVDGMTENLDVVSVPLDADTNQELTVAKSLKTILSMIKESTTKLKAKKVQIRQYDLLIKQLSIFCTLFVDQEKLFKRQPSSSNDDILSCDCSVSSAAVGYSRQWMLKIKLEMCNNFSLSNDWLIAVSMKTSSSLSTYSNLTPKEFNISYPLTRGLEAGTDFVISLPLGKDFDVMCWVESSLNIYLILKSSQRAVESQEDVAGLKVLVHKEDMDICRFLYSDDCIMSTGRREESWLYQELMMLSQTQGRLKHSDSSLSDSLSSSLPVLELVINMPNMSENSVKVLQTILCDSDITSSSCHLTGPDGAQVTISVECCKDDTRSNSKTTDNFSVRLQSSSLVLLHLMRQSLDRKVKNLMQSNQSDEPLPKLQTLLTRFQQIQEKMMTACHKIEKNSLSETESANLLIDCFDKCKGLTLH